LFAENESPIYTWYDAPDETQRLLGLAVEHWQDDERSRLYIERALVSAENNLDVLVSAYRYFFYKADANAALVVADRVIALAVSGLGWPEDWAQQDWEPLSRQLSNSNNETQSRLFLSAYSGKGLLLAKLGRLAEAQKISQRVAALDPRREFGATTLFEVLTEIPAD